MSKRKSEDGTLCARCGEPAKGYATIGDGRYCHEDPRPTCYMQESWERSGATELFKPDREGAIVTRERVAEMRRQLEAKRGTLPDGI